MRATKNKAPELSISKNTGLVFDLHAGLVMVHHDSDKEMVTVTLTKEDTGDNEERPKLEFDRTSIKWEDFVYKVKRLLHIDLSTDIEFKT